MLDKIKPVENAVEIHESTIVTEDNEDLFQKVPNKNVEQIVQLIRTKSPLLASMESNSEITIVAAMYDIEKGKVKFYVDLDGFNRLLI